MGLFCINSLLLDWYPEIKTFLVICLRTEWYNTNLTACNSFLTLCFPHGYSVWIHWLKWLVFELLTATCSYMMNITIKIKQIKWPKQKEINEHLNQIPSFTTFLSFAWPFGYLSLYGNHQEVQDYHRSVRFVIQSKSGRRSLAKCFQIVLLYCKKKKPKYFGTHSHNVLFIYPLFHIFIQLLFVECLPTHITVSFMYMCQRSNPGHHTYKAYTLSELPP